MNPGRGSDGERDHGFYSRPQKEHWIEKWDEEPWRSRKQRRCGVFELQGSPQEIKRGESGAGQSFLHTKETPKEGGEHGFALKHPSKERKEILKHQELGAGAGVGRIDKMSSKKRSLR